jgi:hypothetical protein
MHLGRDQILVDIEYEVIFNMISLVFELGSPRTALLRILRRAALINQVPMYVE